MHKFQTLYVTDFNGFRNQSSKILQVLLKNTDHALFSKLMDEVERLYEELSSCYIHSLMIRFSEDEYRVVPILNNQYHMKL